MVSLKNFDVDGEMQRACIDKRKTKRRNNIFAVDNASIAVCLAVTGHYFYPDIPSSSGDFASSVQDAQRIFTALLYVFQDTRVCSLVGNVVWHLSVIIYL
jgi:hypothetical protein